MNNHTIKNDSQWLASIKSIAATKSSGQYSAKDKNGTPVTIEWYMAHILSPELSQFKKNVSDLSAQATAAVEVELLRHAPTAVHADGFLKACEPLFAQGPEMINWQLVEETIQTTIKQFYLMDMSQFGSEVIGKLIDDIYFFASVKDQQTNTLLGCIMSSVTPALPYGDIKIINISIAPQEQMRDLDKLLLSTIYKVIPSVERMFIITRPTNSAALARYKSYGFVQDDNPITDPNHPIAMEYYVVLEYRTKEADILQKTADTLIE